jgi:hypothetical protein
MKETTLMRHRIRLTAPIALLLALFCQAESATRPADAWPLYAQAAARMAEGNKLGISCPAASNLEYNPFPPVPPEWHRLMKASWDFNTTAREQVHAARAIDTVHWPVTTKDGDPQSRYLSSCRNIAMEIGDAALYQHLRGNDAAAIESLRDLLHLVELFDADSEELVIQSLVSTGIEALSLERLNVVTSDARLTSDKSDRVHLQANTARLLIRRLYTADDPIDRFAAVLKRDIARTKRLNYPEYDATSVTRLTTTVHRLWMERNLTAMSLACHVYHFEKSRWPAAVADLLPYLPAAPVDASGPMGYVLIKAGRPDGADRPLVYSRNGAAAKDQLFYRVDEPQFGYYTQDGSDRPAKLQRQGGQFRDVTLWPAVRPKPAATTKAMN